MCESEASADVRSVSRELCPSRATARRRRSRLTARATRLRLRRIVTLACVAAAVGLTTPVPASGQGTEQKYTLLIGLSQYRQVSDGIVQLSYPDEDVTALTSVLVGQNFQVVSLIDDDAKREDIIQELYHHAEMVRKQDTFLLYFSGHGVRNDAVNGKTYWLTYDAGLAVLDTAGIRIEHLLEYVQDIKAERKIVLLDHCFSGDVVTASSPEITTDAGGGGPGAGARTTGGGRRIAARGVFRDDDWYAEAAPHATGLVMLAAAKDRAFESPTLKHGLFTAALLRALGSRDADTAPRNGRLSANELISFVRTKVAALAAAEGFPPQQPRAFGVGAELGLHREHQRYALQRPGSG